MESTIIPQASAHGSGFHHLGLIEKCACYAGPAKWVISPCQLFFLAEFFLPRQEVCFCSYAFWFTFVCRLFLWRNPKRVSSVECWRCFCIAWPATKVHFISNTASPHRGHWFQRWILCRCCNVSRAVLMEDRTGFFPLHLCHFIKHLLCCAVLIFRKWGLEVDKAWMVFMIGACIFALCIWWLCTKVQFTKAECAVGSCWQAVSKGTGKSGTGSYK